MDLTKLENLIQAFETESKIPYPSHVNLAKLTSMLVQEILVVFKAMHTPAPTPQVTNLSVPEVSIVQPVVLPEPETAANGTASVTLDAKSTEQEPPKTGE